MLTIKHVAEHAASSSILIKLPVQLVEITANNIFRLSERASIGRYTKGFKCLLMISKNRELQIARVAADDSTANFAPENIIGVITGLEFDTFAKI